MSNQTPFKFPRHVFFFSPRSLFLSGFWLTWDEYFCNYFIGPIAAVFRLPLIECVSLRSLTFFLDLSRSVHSKSMSIPFLAVFFLIRLFLGASFFHIH